MIISIDIEKTFDEIQSICDKNYHQSAYRGNISLHNIGHL